MERESFDIYIAKDKEELWKIMEKKAEKEDRSLANYINWVLTKYHNERGYDV